MRNTDLKEISYGSIPVSPKDTEVGKVLREVKKDRSGRRVMTDLEDEHPRMSLLNHNKPIEQMEGCWERFRVKMREVFTKDRLVAIVLWIVILVFIALVIARVVHVEQRKHGHH